MLAALSLTCALVCAAVDEPRPRGPIAAVTAYRKANEVAILEMLRDFVAIPNVTSDRANIRRNAEHLRAELEKRGLRAEILERNGANPLVYAERDVVGAHRTLVVYAHYDGQPVEPVSKWHVDPWKAALYSKPIESGGAKLNWPAAGSRLDPEWRLYGRSAADDKGPIVAILAALDAMRHAGIEPTVNLRFVFDGEEEGGSPNLEGFIDEHPTKLKGNLWLIFDSPTHQSRRPQLVFGVRGLVKFEVTVYGAKGSLHSGHYGNFAPNPALRLAHLLASLKDERGNVLIKCFEESVEPLGRRESEAIARLPNFNAQIREEIQIAESEGNPETYWKRLARPSLTIQGMEGGGRTGGEGFHDQHPGRGDGRS